MKLRSLTFVQLVSREIVSGKIASITDRWTAEVVDDWGKLHPLTFDQTEQPTPQEIADAMPDDLDEVLPPKSAKVGKP